MMNLKILLMNIYQKDTGIQTFQFSPLREGRPITFQRGKLTDVYFNSRPCERGDQVRLGGREGVHGISILAPARGATIARQQFTARIRISILAPARGATRLDDALVMHGKISILAPARGATIVFPPLIYHDADFNSRPCERGDQLIANGWRL